MQNAKNNQEKRIDKFYLIHFLKMKMTKRD